MQRVVNNYPCKFFNHDNLPRDGQTKKGSTLFFKLPFIGPFSRATQRSIKVITKKYFKDLDIRLVFTSYKLENMFVLKDAIPHSMRPLWFTNFHAQAVAPVMSARLPDIFPQEFGSIYFQIVTPIFTNIWRILRSLSFRRGSRVEGTMSRVEGNFFPQFFLMNKEKLNGI